MKAGLLEDVMRTDDTCALVTYYAALKQAAWDLRVTPETAREFLHCVWHNPAPDVVRVDLLCRQGDPPVVLHVQSIPHSGADPAQADASAQRVVRTAVLNGRLRWENKGGACVR